MTRLDDFQPVDFDEMAKLAERFDPSTFIATALVKRALRTAGLQHVVRGAPCIVALAGVPEGTTSIFLDAVESLFQSSRPGMNADRIKVHDRTGTRVNRSPDVSSAIRSLYSARQVCWLFDTADTIPSHVAALTDAIAVLPPPDDELMRAVALHMWPSTPVSSQDLRSMSSAPWPLLGLLLEGGRSLRSAAYLALRISAARQAEETAKSEKSSGRMASTAVQVSSGPTLDDLHGMGEAAIWGRALATDLADYKTGRLGWSEVDRGALLSGAPGTGKTTFALALGRTCDVPVFVHSLARWQAAGYLNALLKEMRAAFAEAIAAAPCILFVDELDSFGDRASENDHNARYTREVINGFLECLDGAEARTGVVVVGATNHPHLIDPAIRRAGRLDRELRIPLPDTSAREAILRYHLRGDLSDCTLTYVAEETEGKSGADLEVLVRTARRLARTARRPLELGDLTQALPRPVMLTEAAFRRICIHEAGHVVVGTALAEVSGSVPVSATVRREIRTSNCNRTEFTIEKGIDGTRGSYLDLVTTMLSGMAAEEEILGDRSDLSGGAADSDLAKATNVVARLELDFGLGARLMAGQPSDADVLNRVRHDRPLRRRIEETLRQCLERARSILRERRADAEAVAGCLAEHGVWHAPRATLPPAQVQGGAKLVQERPRRPERVKSGPRERACPG